MLVDSWYDPYLGVVVLIRVHDGILRKGDRIRMLNTNAIYQVDRVIAIEIENDPTYREIMDNSRFRQKETVADAITVAAREIAETTAVTAICCFTQMFGLL